MKIKLTIYIYWIIVLLFPLDIVNYYFEAMGLPNAPTGIFAYILSILLFIAITLDMKNAKPQKYWIYLVLVNVFFLSMLFAIYKSPKSTFFDYYQVFVFLVGFLVGYYTYILTKSNDFNQRLIIVNIATALFVIAFFRLVRTIPVYNYLRVAEALVLIAFLAHNKVKNLKVDLMLFAINIITLYLVTSRSALAGYIIFFFFFVLLKYGKKTFITLSAFAVGGLGLILLNIQLIMFGNKNRILTLFFNSKKDHSLKMREELFQEGLLRIKNNWFTGQYKGEIKFGDHGVGYYIHNGLSFWSQFGIITFATLMILILIIIFVVIKNRKQLANGNFIMIFSFYTIFTLIMSKSYLFINTYMMLGLILAIFADKNKKENEKNNIPYSQ